MHSGLSFPWPGSALLGCGTVFCQAFLIKIPQLELWSVQEHGNRALDRSTGSLEPEMSLEIKFKGGIAGYTFSTSLLSMSLFLSPAFAAGCLPFL